MSSGLVVLTLVLCVSEASGQATKPKEGSELELTAHEKAARDFAFDGINFKMTEKQIRAAKRRLIVSDKLEESIYRELQLSSKTAAEFTVTCVEGRVLSLGMDYGDRAIADAGGAKMFMDQIKRKFGPSTGVREGKHPSLI
jgi:hypothetical protein